MNSSMVIGDLLGSGTHSRVFSVHNSDGEEFCLKIINQNSLSDSSVKNRYEKCTKILKRFDHPFLLRVFAVQKVEERKVLMIITENCPMTLSEFMTSERSLTVSQVKKIASQVLLVVDFFRKRRRVFNGIHPSKIMIRSNGRICLKEPGFLYYKKRDISAAHLTSDIENYLRTFTFLSPELTQGGKLDHSSDLWCLGVLIFWMISKRVPFRCETPFLLFPCIRDQVIDWGDEENENVVWDTDSRDIITKLLRFEREQRLGYGNNMKKLMSHPFFKDEIRRMKREIRNQKNLKLQSIKDERERVDFVVSFLRSFCEEEEGEESERKENEKCSTGQVIDFCLTFNLSREEQSNKFVVTSKGLLLLG